MLSLISVCLPPKSWGRRGEGDKSDPLETNGHEYFKHYIGTNMPKLQADMRKIQPSVLR